MKFFIPLGFRYGLDGPDANSHVHAVYGPYEDDTAVQEALARKWPNDKTQEVLVFEGQICKVTASPKEKPEADKRAPGNLDNYTKGPEAYTCKDCGGIILTMSVAHPIWDRVMMAGSGECRYEQVPYCPNCEHKPNFHGSPILT